MPVDAWAGKPRQGCCAVLRCELTAACCGVRGGRVMWAGGDEMGIDQSWVLMWLVVLMVMKPGRAGGRRRRGRGLSLDRIVSVTLELVDEQGVGAASMRAVAARLDVEAMSLYKYVATRDELFDAVVDKVVNELSDDPQVTLRPTAGWRPWLHGMGWGVRRYARAHPHAFPLVATRPAVAPWVNPPLRSLRWIEAFLDGLHREGFTDEEVLFSYRTFNSFLLGYLLLETSAITLRDPKPGDGSYRPRPGPAEADPAEPAHSNNDNPADPADPTDPVPAALSPSRSRQDRIAIAEAEPGPELVDPLDEVDASRFPTVHRMAEGLSEDHYQEEFDVGLNTMLDRIEIFRGSPGRPHPNAA
ncbi:MAG: TetR/AcrR family transcriptional regulator [Pseudonocardia sp.]|nr:TetR/AcrR family transcriptional regulator [Pseudonocardia sp.]